MEREDEYLTTVVINVQEKSFRLLSDEGVEQSITCDTMSQFMDLLEMVKCSEEFGVEDRYVEPKTAGVV